MNVVYGVQGLWPLHVCKEALHTSNLAVIWWVVLQELFLSVICVYNVRNLNILLVRMDIQEPLSATP